MVIWLLQMLNTPGYVHSVSIGMTRPMRTSNQGAQQGVFGNMILKRFRYVNNGVLKKDPTRLVQNSKQKSMFQNK